MRASGTRSYGRPHIGIVQVILVKLISAGRDYGAGGGWNRVPSWSPPHAKNRPWRFVSVMPLVHGHGWRGGPAQPAARSARIDVVRASITSVIAACAGAHRESAS